MVTSRIWFTTAQKAGLWERWRQGQSISAISRADGIFVTEKGFCVLPTMRPFSDFPWKAEHYFNENIVSLKPWIAHIIARTIEACSALLLSLANANATRLPTEIAEGYRVFLRDPANRALLRLLEAETEIKPGGPTQRSHNSRHPTPVNTLPASRRMSDASQNC